MDRYMMLIFVCFCDYMEICIFVLICVFVCFFKFYFYMLRSMLVLRSGFKPITKLSPGPIL